LKAWASVKVGDLCDLVNGKAFKPDDWSEAGVPIIRIQNLNDLSKPFNFWAGSLKSQVQVRPQDVLLAWSGTPGSSFGAHIWRGAGGILNQHIFRVDLDNSKVTKDWWVRAVNSRLTHLIDQAHGGVGLQHVTRPMVDGLEIPLPPLPEQRRIAAILDQADALRAKRRAALAQLDEMAQAIFVEMFGDPIANHANFPTKQLGDLVDQSRGISYGIVQRGPDQDQGIGVLRISDLVGGEIDPGKLKYTTPEIANRFRRTRLAGGELVISIRGTVGLVSVVPSYIAGSNVSRELAVIPLNGESSGSFVRDLIRTKAAQKHILDDVRGIAQSGINLEDLRKLPVILPPCGMIKEYEAQTAIFNSLKLNSVASLKAFDSLFASLQHRAFRGEL
jgi:type I restriction enzyme, S subunit